MGYLISLHDNEVDWNLLGIKVIGHIDALPIPEGTYEYGDAYMVGTETPYDMYIYTRPDGNVHTEGYWFPVGKFPAPGPQGPKGDGPETLTSIDTGSSQYATYDTTDGINATYDTIINYKDSTTGESKSQTVSLYAKTPILPGKYISIGNHDSRNVDVGVDDTKLALDFYQVVKPSDGSTSVPAWDGTKIVSIPYNKNEYAPLKNALVKTGSKGEISVNRIYFPSVNYEGESSAFVFSGKSYSLERMFLDLFTKDLEIATSASNSGTLGGGDLWRVNNGKNINILYRGHSHVRQSPVLGTIKYVSTEVGYDTITIRNFVVSAQSGAWTWTETTFPTVSYYTHRVVIYDGGDNKYYTITLTNSRADAYANLGDHLTSLFNNIGTAGIMAYKQAPDGEYVPVLLTQDSTSQSAIHWQTGTSSGTFEQSNIADIQDHITPAITNN